MTQTLAKQANALVTLYVKLFTEKYDKKPSINRYREKYGFQDMISDLGYERAREVLEYYFQTSRPLHPVKHLLYNYEQLDTIMKEKAEDEKNREELRQRTKQRVEEWDANGNT